MRLPIYKKIELNRKKNPWVKLTEVFFLDNRLKWIILDDCHLNQRFGLIGVRWFLFKIFKIWFFWEGFGKWDAKWLNEINFSIRTKILIGLMLSMVNGLMWSLTICCLITEEIKNCFLTITSMSQKSCGVLY